MRFLQPYHLACKAEVLGRIDQEIGDRRGAVYPLSGLPSSCVGMPEVTRFAFAQVFKAKHRRCLTRLLMLELLPLQCCRQFCAGCVHPLSGLPSSCVGMPEVTRFAARCIL